MKRLYKLLLPLLLITIISCDEIFEDDISDGLITALYPLDGEEIMTNVIDFQWLNMDGANSYRIQIINENHSIAIDSLVGNNTLNLELETGYYTWRVRGENDAYYSVYNFPISFEVDIPEDLTNLVVILDNPSDGIYTNSSSLTYSWFSLSNATNYEFELVKALGGNIIIYEESNIIDTSVVPQSSLYTDDAEYIWKVKATNAISETMFSQRSILLDRTNPNQPILNSPVADGSGSSPIIFNWSLGTDTGNIQSERTSFFEIATDISFTDIIYSNDNAGESVQYEFSANGDYFWRVKTQDGAGNQSQFSNIRKITVM